MDKQAADQLSESLLRALPKDWLRKVPATELAHGVDALLHRHEELRRDLLGGVVTSREAGLAVAAQIKTWFVERGALQRDEWDTEELVTALVQMFDDMKAVRTADTGTPNP
jgi:hypothetical protein